MIPASFKQELFKHHSSIIPATFQHHHSNFPATCWNIARILLDYCLDTAGILLVRPPPHKISKQNFLNKIRQITFFSSIYIYLTKLLYFLSKMCSVFLQISSVFSVEWFDRKPLVHIQEKEVYCHCYYINKKKLTLHDVSAYV